MARPFIGVLLTVVSLLAAFIIGSTNVEAWNRSITPHVTVGYKHIGLNLNVPSPSRDAMIDLYIRDASCLTGGMGVSGQSGQLLGSVAIEATEARDIDVITPQNEQWSGRPLPFKWPGAGFATWDIDGTVGWLFNQNCSPLLGLRYDCLTVAMGMPTDGAGAPLIGSGVNATFGGDLKVKTWIPYLGMKLTGQNYSALLLYSPIASTTAITSQSGGGPGQLVDWDWAINGTGSFAELDMSYSIISGTNIQCGIWGRFTWMRLNGPADWTGTVKLTPGPQPNQDTDECLLSRNDMSIGIQGNMRF